LVTSLPAASASVRRVVVIARLVTSPAAALRIVRFAVVAIVRRVRLATSRAVALGIDPPGAETSVQHVPMATSRRGVRVRIARSAPLTIAARRVVMIVPVRAARRGGVQVVESHLATSRVVRVPKVVAPAPAVRVALVPRVDVPVAHARPAAALRVESRLVASQAAVAVLPVRASRAARGCGLLPANFAASS
jgi:hypothetical protein